MLNYAVCEIGGKQYIVIPNQPLVVDNQDENIKKIEANVLLFSEDGKIKVGKPYLKEKLSLEVMGQIRGEKIRVSKFHAKANYRKVKGHRAKMTRVILPVKNSANS